MKFRTIVSLSLVAAVLAACGGKATPTPTSGVANTPAAQSPTARPTTASAKPTVAPTSASAQPTTAPEPWTSSQNP